MEVLESEVLESICETLRSNRMIALYSLLQESKPYFHYDCYNRKIIYFVFGHNHKFAVKRVSDTKVNKELKKIISEEIGDIDDVQAILESEIKEIIESEERNTLSDSLNRIILDVINKNNRLRDELKIVIKNKTKILNTELDELKYQYYDITKSKDQNMIEQHISKIEEKENEIECCMRAVKEL